MVLRHQLPAPRLPEVVCVSEAPQSSKLLFAWSLPRRSLPLQRLSTPSPAACRSVLLGVVLLPALALVGVWATIMRGLDSPWRQKRLPIILVQGSSLLIARLTDWVYDMHLCSLQPKLYAPLPYSFGSQGSSLGTRGEALGFTGQRSLFLIRKTPRSIAGRSVLSLPRKAVKTASDATTVGV